MTDRRLFAVVTVLLMVAACTGGETEDVNVEPLPHACVLLEQVDTKAIVGFESERIQRTEEKNDQYNVQITQCDHYGEDMSQRFSLVIRQDFSNRKLKSGEEQLAELRAKLGEFAQDGIEWRDIDSLGEAAAWNGTANQLTVYEDKAHTTLAFSVYGTENNFEKALDLAHVTMMETHYAPQQ
jgi:hypothetical protein